MSNVIHLKLSSARKTVVVAPAAPHATDALDTLRAPQHFSFYAQGDIGRTQIEGEGSVVLVKYLRHCLAQREELDRFINDEVARLLQLELDQAAAPGS